MTYLTGTKLEKAAAILSLDQVQPFYGPMGLDTAGQAAFCKALKQGLSGFFVAKASEAATSDDALRAKLVEGIGPDGVAAFERWFRSVWHENTDQNLRLWELMFMGWCRSQRKWPQLGFPEAISETLRQDCVAATGTADVDRQAAAATAAQHSDWDLMLFSLFGFDDDEMNPLTEVTLTVTHHRFQGFWRRLETALGDAGRSRFLEAANALAKQEGCPITLAMPATELWPR